MISNGESFDVFLCHNSKDKPAVLAIAEQLKEKGLNPWVDKDGLRPGTSWQTEIGEQITSVKAAAIFIGPSGIGPWQDEEIQAFLNQLKKRSCPVVPVILKSVPGAPQIPWTLENRHQVDMRTDDPDPMEQLLWGISGNRPEEHKEPELVRRVGPADETLAYTPLSTPPEKEEQNQLSILRNRVQEYWVDGVLHNSLHHQVLISLGKHLMDDAVDVPPWKYSVELSSENRERSFVNRDIESVFDATGLVLILGAPGSGKTTTLLELASKLLNRAQGSALERIPVVLNLSSWNKRQTLVAWVAAELFSKYRVPAKIGKRWLESGYLAPLLDGLDEVHAHDRAACVAAINEFIETHDPQALVVCSRLMAYQWLPERLKLDGAVCLEALSQEEVRAYFDNVGAPLNGLRAAIETDPIFRELTETPLMLSVMSLAYEGVSADEVTRGKIETPQEWRNKIFSLYVERMFDRKGSSAMLYPKNKVIGRLSWLARRMKEHSQSVFMVEGLQPSWLSGGAQRVAYGAIVALILAPVFGLAYGLLEGLDSGLSAGLARGLASGLGAGLSVFLGCWSRSALKNGLCCGLIGGLVGGLTEGLLVGSSDEVITEGMGVGLACGLIGGLGIGSLNEINLVEGMHWQLKQFRKMAIRGSTIGGIFGLVVGLILGPLEGFDSQAISDLIEGLMEGLIEGIGTSATGTMIGVLIYGLIVLAITGLAVGVIMGSLFGVIGGLFAGLLGGITAKVRRDKGSPNQGIELSLRNAAIALGIVGLSVGLSSGLLGGLLEALNPEPSEGLNLGLYMGPYLGLFFGLIAGLNRGGSAAVKHYSIRLILWMNGHTPFRFIKLLDHCALLILLKKVGGGYMFTHRMLLEYFAELNPESPPLHKR